MKRMMFKAIVVAGLAGAMALAGAGPAAAQSKRQQDKNLMRNLGIGLGVAAVHQALKGNKTNALVLGAGAAVAGSEYEAARKKQSEENDWRFGRYDNDRRYDDRYRYDDRRDDTYRDNDRRYDDRRYDNGRYDDRRYEGSSRSDGRVRYYQQGKGGKIGQQRYSSTNNKKADCR